MNRKLLFLLAIIMTSYYSSAQIGKGSVMLGGQIGYTSENVRSQTPAERSEADYLTTSIVFGKAVKENLFLGFNVSMGLTKRKSQNYYEQELDSYGASVFIRRYFEIGRKFYIFTQGHTGASFFENDEKYNLPVSPSTSNEEGYLISLSFYPGISYAITRRFHIETGFNNLVSANFMRSKFNSSQNAEGKRTNFNISTSLHNPGYISVGVRFLFSK
jgi:hypothetical protein